MRTCRRGSRRGPSTALRWFLKTMRIERISCVRRLSEKFLDARRGKASESCGSGKPRRARFRMARRLCVYYLPAQPVANLSKIIDAEMAEQRLSCGLVDGNPPTLAFRLLNEHNPTHDACAPHTPIPTKSFCRSNSGAPREQRRNGCCLTASPGLLRVVPFLISGRLRVAPAASRN